MTTRGQGSLVIMVVMMVSVGMVMVGITRPFQAELAYAKVGMDVTQLTATVMGRVKEFLVQDVSGCTAENKAFEEFREFNGNSATLEMANTQAYACLIEDDEEGLLSDWLIRVEQLRLDPNALLRRVRVTVTMRTQETAETFVRSHTLTRDYDVRIPSFAYFNISFFGIPQVTPLITVNGAGKLTVHGRTFYAEGLPLRLSHIYSVNGHTNASDGLSFQKTFHMQPYVLNVDGASPVVDMKDLRNIFHEGIEPRTLSYETLTQFKPTDSAPSSGDLWNYELDYGPYSSGHIQLSPPSIGGADSGASCEGAPYPYSASRATFDVIPDPSPGARPEIDGLMDLNESCNAGEDRPRPFVHVRFGEDFTINFGDTVDDVRLCGLIAAKTLTINLGNERDDYYLVANLMIERLIVNTNGRRLHIIHPQDPSQRINQTEIFGDDKGGRDDDFARLSVSFGKNFYLPFVENSPFLPEATTSLLQDCEGDGSRWGYEETYPPFHTNGQWGEITGNCRNAVRIAEKVT